MSSARRDTARAFGRVLRAARLAKGLSQEQLAEGADLDPTYPSLLERGLRTPTLTVLIDIGRALEIEPSRLVMDTLEQMRVFATLSSCHSPADALISKGVRQ